MNDHPSFAPFRQSIGAGQNLLIEKLWDAPKAFLIALAAEVSGKHIVVITGGMREEHLYNDFPLFTKAPVLEFPAWETLPSEEITPSPDVVGERYEVLRKLLHTDPHILLCPLQSCLQRVIPPDVFTAGCQTLEIGQTLLFEEMIAKLPELGFVQRPVASDKGEFAVRGGIIDLFPVGTPDPYRLEFFGDQIESIRIYDPIGQKSLERVEKLTLTPAREQEFLGKQKELATLFDYLGPNTLLVFDDLLALEDRYASLAGLPGALSRSFASFGEFLEETASLQRIYLTKDPIDEMTQVTVPKGTRFYSAGGLPQELTFEMFDRKLEAHRWRPPFSKIDESRGFFVEPEGPEWVPPGDQPKIHRPKNRSSHHTTPSEYLDLKPGDVVVHLENGIGKFLGVDKRKNHQGQEVEFLIIEYADEGKLFVPLTQAHMVTKYIGAHEEVPTLHSLGSKKWQRTRAVTEAAIRDYAKDLLKLQAEREIAGGFVYPSDSDMTRQFTNAFPFHETEDQLAAIEAVKKDMEGPNPMDRLVCGDVGYGKTEVAMRAAVKAVVDGGKQVAVLVPTTILAMQHFDNFSERMADLPIQVEALSRFRKTKRADLEKADILIGTHRILGKDVTFKNLGLVIIDEEQRFGVRVKEKLRSLKKGVDCLTLSATPIPRTLHMSLVGARDLSVINTPPHDRLPIKTILCEFDEEKVKSALLRELSRDGQAYIVHNRVETIFEMGEKIRQLLPQARILVGHGQMGADELDAVFHQFKSGHADILIATSIIENGVDIPNANTIIVDRADRFGLADLYQLRGRVGRWNRRAYAYFCAPRIMGLPELSRRRLSALLEIQGGYGGGMKLAMRDLEIRGAGNILGTEQSGHVAAIGFHFYCKLLKRTVAQMQGDIPPAVETRIDFPFDARLPEDYVNEPSLRMEIYQRFGEATSVEEVDELTEEVRDRFGPLPPPVEWLQAVMRIRVRASQKGITSLKMQRFTLAIEEGKKKRTAVIARPKTPQELEEQVCSTI